MKKKSIVGFIVLVLAAGGAVAGWFFWPAKKIEIKTTEETLKKGDDFPHEIWTKVLKKHSKAGFMNYEALKADPGDLNAYLGYVAKYSPQSNPELFPTREDQLAYAINAYNAYVAKGVIDNWPIQSVREVGPLPGAKNLDFFKKFEYPFGPKAWTLEGWETWIREAFNEPRIHFALNCASIGCPRLPEEAFTPGDLEKQLARETKKFVNEERNVLVAEGKAKVSSIFKWYRGDFESWQESKGKAKSLAAYIREVGRDVPDGEMEFVPYDWGINVLK